MKKAIKWGLVILWMIIIFIFSSQNGDVSDEKSRMLISFFKLIGLNLDSTFGQLSDFIVRKTAHFTEYFILSMLLYNALIDEFKIKAAIFIAIISVFLYACTDEFHQTFIPGRTGRFRDVLIDTSGGSTAAAIVYLRYRLRHKKM